MISDTPYNRLIQIQEHICQLCHSIGRDPQSVKIVVVTKHRPVVDIQDLYQQGICNFAENRVQDLVQKMDALPSEINWHLIGTLQSNKINKIIGLTSLIHSVDSLELAKKLSDSSERNGIVTSILLQVNASGEGSKHGLTIEQCREQFEHFLQLEHVNIRGLMTMAPKFSTEHDKESVRLTFRKLAQLLNQIKSSYPEKSDQLTELSMGMSQDYEIAIEEGATLIRIGTALFAPSSC